MVLVEVTEVGEDEGADGFWLALTSGPWVEATEGLVVLPLFEASHLRAVDIEWEEPAARRSGSRSLGQHAPRAVVAGWAAHDDAPVPAPSATLPRVYSVHGTHVVPGMSPQAEAKAHRWEIPSLVVALLIPPVLVLRELELLAPAPELLFYPITAFLIVEALRIVTLCPDRKDWARRNLIDLVIIAAAVASLPFTGESNDWVSVILLLRVLDLLPLVHRYVVRVTPAIFAVSLLLIVWLMGGLSFVQVETPEDGGGYTLLEGLYWSMTTITTVGYGDLSPSTPMGMVLTMILQPAGLFVGALIVAAAVGFFNREFAMGFLGRVEQKVDDLVDDPRADDPK